MPVRGICEADAGAECATDLLGYTCNLKLLSLGSAPKIGYNDARTIAEHFAAFDPSRCTSKSSRSGRAGKVFIDYLRNGRGKTAIGPYSPRARPGFPVARPRARHSLRCVLDAQSARLLRHRGRRQCGERERADSRQ